VPDDPTSPPVVRAARFELTHPDGSTRAALHGIERPAGSWWPALSLYDTDGAERVVLLLGPDGPVLSFASSTGNVAAELGVLDPGAQPWPSGAYLLLGGNDGTLAWKVAVDGPTGRVVES
jgi:hypothetical protein